MEASDFLQKPDVGDYLTDAKGERLCFCGDPRSDHPNDGPCIMNGLGRGVPPVFRDSFCPASERVNYEN